MYEKKNKNLECILFTEPQRDVRNTYFASKGCFFSKTYTTRFEESQIKGRRKNETNELFINIYRIVA